MTVEYRAGTVADIPAIDRVFRDSFDDTFGHLYRPEDLSAFMTQFTPETWAQEMESCAFRLAEADGEIVGFLKLGPLTLPVETDQPAIELRQLYLVKDWHGRGLAHALTDWAIAEARRQGARELYLTVYTDNHRARRFYDKYGFVEVGPYAFMVGNHADEDIIMKLVL